MTSKQQAKWCVVGAGRKQVKKSPPKCTFETSKWETHFYFKGENYE